MRLQSHASNSNLKELIQFAEWLLSIGNGNLSESNNDCAEIHIPDEFLITNFIGSIHAIVQSTYPNIVENFKNEKFLESKAILASNIETIDEINNYIISLVLGHEKEYLSFDSVDRSDIVDNSPIQTITP
ncbi:uncharacterized protein LOC114191323 [Vigna unguiculata]|uniref:uncharacterized protein LOC114191323 n=1 Tax=Vigna unguiculata TaxID=3917 RepID=UPI0010164F1F|nr:uncharacterized protein LOC114191323 [Vigna unguiculata]